MNDHDRRSALDEFYELIDVISERCGGPRRLRDCTSASGWPDRGVYFFFENGELRDDGHTPRVTRVGTHALNAGSRTTLWNRLSNHRGNVGGANPGGGNHRGSIFRLHIGTALINRDRVVSDGASTWGQKNSASRDVRLAESDLERAVSAYIGNMPVLWLEVADAPGPDSQRGLIERGAISLLSNSRRIPIDPPSAGWLGRHADRAAVRDSGMWNVKHVYEPASAVFLSAMKEQLARS